MVMWNEVYDINGRVVVRNEDCNDKEEKDDSSFTWRGQDWSVHGSIHAGVCYTKW